MCPLIISEVSANLCCKKSLLLQLIKFVAKNVADFIKIQTYKANDITINKYFNIKNWNKKNKNGHCILDYDIKKMIKKK